MSASTSTSRARALATPRVARARESRRAMSAVYALEPPTEGKAVVHTTHGELEIEFFAREAPLACRNFVQLALEGCVRTRSRAADRRD